MAARETVAEEEETATKFRTLPAAMPKSGQPGRITEPATGVSAKSKAADPGRIEIEPTENFEKILKRPS